VFFEKTPRSRAVASRFFVIACPLRDYGDGSDLNAKLVEKLLNLERTEAFTREKILMEKHREDWPELWEILDAMVYLEVIYEKFGDEQ
jgi:hypothetical protein